MARQKDIGKRSVILREAKRLFAGHGYENATMGMVADAIGIPVGSLYTYFDSKEILLGTIIEDGWKEFELGLKAGLEESAIKAMPDSSPHLAMIAYLVRVALPKLFEDLDLIAILLAQAGRFSRLEEKLDSLAGLVSSIVVEYRAGRDDSSLDRSKLRTGLAVMLLGSLEAMRLIFHADLKMSGEDVIAFLASTVETALGCELPPANSGWPATDSSP